MHEMNNDSIISGLKKHVRDVEAVRQGVEEIGRP